MAFLISTTFGALLLGGLCAAALSGFVTMQTFLYIKLFPRDSVRLKAIVALVWTLDTTHSLLVYTSIWIYFIPNYGDAEKINTIIIPLALTGLLTAIMTFVVHCFFAYRIHKLSQHQWRFTALILVLAFCRLCSGTVTIAEMMHTKTFTAMKAQFRWLITLGLAMSTVIDILITSFLTHLLHAMRREIEVSTSMDRVIGGVVLYTFETNLLTIIATSTSMICWLTMPYNLTFFGIHFFIGKLYANSLLATLNSRQQLQQERQRGTSIDLPLRCAPRATTSKFLSHDDTRTPSKLEISVSRTVEFKADEPMSSQKAEHVSIVRP